MVLTRFEYIKDILRDNELWAELDELETFEVEHERLREALEAMRTLASVSCEGDPWYAEHEGLDADAIFAQARAALQEREETIGETQDESDWRLRHEKDGYG